MPAQNILKVSEIFYSIQGEGFYTGIPMIFIRLAGCSMGCDFCDTKYSWNGGIGMTLDEILKEIRQYPCNRVCITGGEPMEQNLSELKYQLHKSGYSIHLETNGAHKIPLDTTFDWVTISPKKRFRKQNLKVAAEIKCVITCEKDLKKYWRRYHKYSNVLFFVPMSNSMEIALMIVDFIKKKKEVRLGWQLQKTLFVK